MTVSRQHSLTLATHCTLHCTAAMLEEALPAVDMIKEELDVEEQNIPHSWDSGVVLDTVTALQMAEFQKVVDNLHRQVAPQAAQPPPPPYPYTVYQSSSWTSLNCNLFFSFQMRRKTEI